MIRKEIMPGVYLTYIQAKKFKTNVMSAQLLCPLSRENAAKNALLPAVLRRGTARYPDMRSFSRALDMLYGARIEDVVRKKSETQCIGFVASVIDDNYAPGGERLLEKTADIMGDLLCSPATKNGRFIGEYVESEKQNLIDDIRSIVNEKRSYAGRRIIEEMCGDEPYGVSRLGYEEDVAAITPIKLYKYYNELLATSPVELFYCGSADKMRVENAFRSALSTLPRGGVTLCDTALPHIFRGETKVVEEEMDVTQGKLSMGFSCSTADYPAMLMANTIFGGTSTSKLFMNVREKLSLCYFASSSLHRSKGIVTVSSGVEFENYQKAYDEILAQVESIKRGDMEEWEITGARSNLLNSTATMGDSAGALEEYWLGQAVLGISVTPEQLGKDIEAVTKERIVAAANSMRLDTVYFLKGKESGAEE